VNLPLVLSLPHSSGLVPPEMAQDMALGFEPIAMEVDWGAAEVLGALPFATVVRAEVSRLVVDLNRAPDDLGGKGVVAARDYQERKVFKPGRRPVPAEVARRVELWHRPFHEELAKALAAPGVRGLIDGHSLDPVGPPGAGANHGKRRADVCLGNRGGPDGGGNGLTCPAGVLLTLAKALEGEGLSVSLNRPYPGGYIVARHGPALMARGGFALQIELNKGLYLDARGRVEPARAAELSGRLDRALRSALG